jgi:hypothetical protein
MSVLGRHRPAGRRGDPLWARLYRGLLNLLYLRRPPAQVCLECSVDYVPELTEGRCPICGTRTEADPQALRRSRRRALAGLALVWLVAVIIFLLLVHALYG